MQFHTVGGRFPNNPGENDQGLDSDAMQSQEKDVPRR